MNTKPPEGPAEPDDGGGDRDVAREKLAIQRQGNASKRTRGAGKPFTKGNRAASGPRPKSAREVAILARALVPGALAGLARLSISPDEPASARVRALELLLERGLGRVPTTVEIDPHPRAAGAAALGFCLSFPEGGPGELFVTGGIGAAPAESDIEGTTVEADAREIVPVDVAAPAAVGEAPAITVDPLPGDGSMPVAAPEAPPEVVTAELPAEEQLAAAVAEWSAGPLLDGVPLTAQIAARLDADRLLALRDMPTARAELARRRTAADAAARADRESASEVQRTEEQKALIERERRLAVWSKLAE